MTTLPKTLSDRTLEIEHLELWSVKFQRMQFGRKSEKIDRQIEQLELRLEDLQADDGAATVDAPKRTRLAPASRRDEDHCRSTCHTKTLFISLTMHAAHSATAHLVISVKT